MKFRILFSVLLCCSVAKAQDAVPVANTKDFMFSISSGFSIPWGKFAESDRADTSCGFATGGVVYNAALQYRILPFAGLALGAGACANSFHYNYADKYFYPENNSITWNSLGYYYSVRYYMAGLYFNDWEGDESRFGVNARLLYGITQMDVPSVNMTGKSEGQTIGYSMPSMTARSTGFLAGVGARIILTKSVELVFNADYLFSTFNFGGKEFIISKNGKVESDNITLKLPGNTLNFSTGLGFMF